MLTGAFLRSKLSRVLGNADGRDGSPIKNDYLFLINRNSSHSRVTGMKGLLWHNMLTFCWRLRADKIGMISDYQVHLKSCDLMQI